jgi:hypothetical protein
VVVRDAAPTRTQVEATFVEADRRAALRRQHDIKGTITGDELLTNPFQYQDPSPRPSSHPLIAQETATQDSTSAEGNSTPVECWA